MALSYAQAKFTFLAHFSIVEIARPFSLRETARLPCIHSPLSWLHFFRENLDKTPKTSPIFKIQIRKRPEISAFEPDLLESLREAVRGGYTPPPVTLSNHAKTRSQVQKTARFYMLILSKSTPFRHCKRSASNAEIWAL